MNLIIKNTKVSEVRKMTPNRKMGFTRGTITKQGIIKTSYSSLRPEADEKLKPTLKNLLKLGVDRLKQKFAASTVGKLLGMKPKEELQHKSNIDNTPYISYVHPSLIGQKLRIESNKSGSVHNDGNNSILKPKTPDSPIFNTETQQFQIPERFKPVIEKMVQVHDDIFNREGVDIFKERKGRDEKYSAEDEEAHKRIHDETKEMDWNYDDLGGYLVEHGITKSLSSGGGNIPEDFQNFRLLYNGKISSTFIKGQPPEVKPAVWRQEIGAMNGSSEQPEGITKTQNPERKKIEDAIKQEEENIKYAKYADIGAGEEESQARTNLGKLKKKLQEFDKKPEGKKPEQPNSIKSKKIQMPVDGITMDAKGKIQLSPEKKLELQQRKANIKLSKKQNAGKKIKSMKDIDPETGLSKQDEIDAQILASEDALKPFDPIRNAMRLDTKGDKKLEGMEKIRANKIEILHNAGSLADKKYNQLTDTTLQQHVKAFLDSGMKPEDIKLSLTKDSIKQKKKKLEKPKTKEDLDKIITKLKGEADSKLKKIKKLQLLKK